MIHQRRAQYASTLKKSLITKLSLPKNLKLRRKIVEMVKKLHEAQYERDGNLKEKRRRNNIQYSQTLDRWENFDDDGSFTIDDTDVQT